METFVPRSHSLHKSKFSDNLNLIVLTQRFIHIETSQLICFAKHFTDVYMTVTMLNQINNKLKNESLLT